MHVDRVAELQACYNIILTSFDSELRDDFFPTDRYYHYHIIIISLLL